ncbi:16S rRNA (adenine(1518)-N(6)/adenine(1519)-N(6))-dimethyltransferase RsmA [Actinomycetaceae bacterium TAE3-ERU4]|nr:16S rRNA (adenine(1518)-N(6)/adenine(1519)-N(6))-dimethyltransferase RsmA [Actinomycetaceae bacterium TAE3-ERU4]
MNDFDVKLLGKAQVRELCEGLNIRPTKTLGQNFVHDTGTVEKIVREARVRPGEHVLEVGPGLGSLTLALLKAQARVTAVEIDPKLAQILPTTADVNAGKIAQNLRILLSDALKIDSPDCLEKAVPVRPGTDFSDQPTKLVANLPYNVAVPVIFTLLEVLPSLKEVLVMVQSEVADRLAALPGTKAYGVPSVKAQWYGPTKKVGTIGRNVFWPSPNVDSALVRMEITHPHGNSDEERKALFKAVDAAFSQRRKTLRSALANWAGSPAAAAQICQAAGIDSTLRGERLVATDFAKLIRAHAQVNA